MKRVLFIVILCLLPSLCLGLSPEYKSSMLGEMRFLLWSHPHVVYVWGAADPYDKNAADCSGTFYGICHRIGMPVQRTTAYEMEAGRAGWKNRATYLDKAGESAIVWWTWPGKEATRPHGHIGMLMVNPNSGLLEVVHNNLSKGLHIEPLENALLDYISSIKDLTIGEKEVPKLGPGVKQVLPKDKK